MGPASAAKYQLPCQKEIHLVVQPLVEIFFYSLADSVVRPGTSGALNGIDWNQDTLCCLKSHAFTKQDHSIVVSTLKSIE